MTAGTENSDEARDFSLPLKNRFFIQPLGPAEAAVRAKESAKEIVGVKSFIDKKAWPYVQNDLRSKAEYLRYDLNTVIAAKPKDEKLSLKALAGKLFQDISDVSSQLLIYFSFAFLPFTIAIKYILCVLFISSTMLRRSRAPLKRKSTTRKLYLHSTMFSPSLVRRIEATLYNVVFFTNEMLLNYYMKFQ